LGLKLLSKRKINLVSNEPAILFFDIETMAMLVPTFRLGKQHVDYSQILKREQVMCISYAWNTGKVQHLQIDLGRYNILDKDDDADYEMLKAFSEEYNKADLVVAHNGCGFDIPKLLSRIVKYKLPPLAPVVADDTYFKSKGIGFTSHKQDDLADYLGYGTKADHGKGMAYWIAVMYGDQKILDRMVKYCDRDVVMLRKIYNHLKPYIKTSLPLSVFNGTPSACKSCGKLGTLQKRGWRITTANRYQRYQCASCGVWSSDGVGLVKNGKHFNR
jgi:uncharacterized protein YprB with RNaseH-like and TPR domain